MSQQTKQTLSSLPHNKRQQVERIVMRYASRHNEFGILPNELEPIYCDVIEAVKLQASFPENHLPMVHTWEEAQHLTRYFAAHI